MAGIAKYHHLRPPLPESFWTSFANAERIVVCSLSPDIFGPNPNGKKLRSYPILSDIEVVDPQVIAGVCSVLRAGAAEGTLGMRCFNPHHAVRAFLGDAVLDLIICFSCTNALVFQEAGGPETSPRGM